MKIIDLSYHSSYIDLSPEEYIKKARSNIGYSNYLKDDHELTFIFHSSHNKQFSIEGVKYIFRKKRINSKWLIPLSLTLYISRLKPDVVLVHGMIYIHFAAFLKLFLPSKTEIFIQNHAEKVPDSILKRTVFRGCRNFIKGYLFTSRDLAKPWVARGLISSSDKVYEIMEGSSSFKRDDKSSSRLALGLADIPSFIWVGRLDENKDPLCVLKALSTYAKMGNKFKLYMFYNAENLLNTIKRFVEDNALNDFVELRGKLKHEHLEKWYNASDYFIAASHSEGSGYALCEAMSCGCIPIVSDIPSFRYMTADGKAALLFPPGDAAKLVQRLEELHFRDIGEMESKVIEVYKDRLSFSAIANGFQEIFKLEK